MMEQMSLVTLHGLLLTTLNGDQGTLAGLALSTLISRTTSKDIQRRLLIGSRNSLQEARTRALQIRDYVSVFQMHFRSCFSSNSKPSI